MPLNYIDLFAGGGSCIDLGRPSANGLTRMRKCFFLYQQCLEPQMAPISHDTLVKQMKALKRLPKLKGKASEKVAAEIALRKKNLLEMDSIYVQQYEDLLFVVELVRGTNWERQIAIAANIAPKDKAILVAKATDLHLKADVAPPHYKE